MKFYRTCMRHASIVLFWVAIIIAVVLFLGMLGSSWEMVSSGLNSAYEPHSPLALWTVLTSAASALSSAVLPFFGAALLFSIEKHWQEKSE